MATLFPFASAGVQCRQSMLARRIALALSFSAATLFTAALQAEPVGNLAELTQTGGSVQIATASGALVQLDVLKPALIRIQAGLNGKLVGEGRCLSSG